MCGLFAIVNHHKRQLDKRAFITLGCANDSRGGDACGIMIDRQVEHGTAKEDQYFQEWFPKSKLLNDTEKCYVALGHCRKASVGGVDPSKAQPVVINDNEGNMLFCVIHNGTIYNYKELATKYIPDIDIKDMTDSQVMAHIFFYKGYDVLAEYNGGGAFIIQDYRVNKTFVFKGESIGSLTTGAKTVVERPLYFVQTGKSVIFSSIYDILRGLYWGFTTYDVPSNVLMQCDGETLYKVKEYDRTKQHGCKLYTKPTPKSNAKIINEYYESLYEDFSRTYSGVAMVDFDTFTGTYINSATQNELHGIIYISSLGYISKYATGFNTPYYFWEGIMLSGENAYNAVRDFHASKQPTANILNLARRLSCNPVVVNKRYCTYTAENKRIYCTDDYSFPLTNVELVFNNHGKVVVTYENTSIDPFVPVNLTKEKVNEIVNYVKDSIRRKLA
jgi:hypothetical protein